MKVNRPKQSTFDRCMKQFKRELSPRLLRRKSLRIGYIGLRMYPGVGSPAFLRTLEMVRNSAKAAVRL